MKKIRDMMTKMSDEIRELAKRFPLTIGLIVFVTVLYTIMVDQNFSSHINQMLEKVYLFSVIWGIGTFFTESWFAQKTSKIWSYGLTGGISFIFTHILTQSKRRNGLCIAIFVRI